LGNAGAIFMKKTKDKKVVKKTATKKVAKKKTATKKASVKKSATKKTASKKTEKNDLLEMIIDAVQEKKGDNLVVLDLREIHSRVCDYFVICEGRSTTQVDAIADSVKYEVKKKLNQLPYHSEGYTNSEWILIDYVNIVVHVFQPQVREFYNIEGLWADADVKHYNN